MDPKIKDTPEKEIGQVESPAASDAKTLSSWDDINKKMDAGTIQRKRPATKSAINLSNNKALEGNVVVNKPDIDSSRLEIIIESSRDSSNSPALDSTSLDSNSAPMELDNSLNKDINDTISHLNAHRKNETTPPEETKEIQQQITDAFKTKASSLPKSSKTQREPHKEPDMEPQELKDKILQVGDRVYAPFPGKDPYNESKSR